MVRRVAEHRRTQGHKHPGESGHSDYIQSTCSPTSGSWHCQGKRDRQDLKAAGHFFTVSVLSHNGALVTAVTSAVDAADMTTDYSMQSASQRRRKRTHFHGRNSSRKRNLPLHNGNASGPSECHTSYNYITTSYLTIFASWRPPGKVRTYGIHLEDAGCGSRHVLSAAVIVSEAAGPPHLSLSVARAKANSSNCLLEK